MTDRGSPRIVELSLHSGREASELWMTQGPELAGDAATSEDKAATFKRKSQRPIPWCLDNPLKFPWLKLGQRHASR